MDDWPDIEEIPVEHKVDGEPGDLADFRSADSAMEADPEDTRWLTMMLVLNHISQTGEGSLSLSDGFTSHVVGATAVFQEGRTYRVVYRDPWLRASFLEEGRNVAGVRARRFGTQGHFSVSLEELILVLDSMTPLPEPQ
jgi:hypothetical protein